MNLQRWSANNRKRGNLHHIVVWCNGNTTDFDSVIHGSNPCATSMSIEITPLEKAQQLYCDAYMRWCYELSHEKNEAIAKNICEYVCNEVLGYMGADRGHEFWTSVREHVRTKGHRELYKSK